MQASPTMSLKTNVDKMSICGLATMLMKTQDILAHSHDVYENEWDSFGEAQETMRVYHAVRLQHVGKFMDYLVRGCL